MNKITGGCQCGEVRFETISEPVLQSLCYCLDCQTISGAAGYAAYGVPIESLTVTKGQLAEYDVQGDSGRINSRRFCPKCGTRMYAYLEELGIVTINALTLDDSNRFQPTTIHYPESAPSWCPIDANLELLPPIPKEI